MLDQLPEFVQNRIYRQFLFSDFLQVFSDTFRIRNKKQKVYTWED